MIIAFTGGVDLAKIDKHIIAETSPRQKLSGLLVKKAILLVCNRL
jgi:hypothetical protein